MSKRILPSAGGSISIPPDSCERECSASLPDDPPVRRAAAPLFHLGSGFKKEVETMPDPLNLDLSSDEDGDQPACKLARVAMASAPSDRRQVQGFSKTRNLSDLVDSLDCESARLSLKKLADLLDCETLTRMLHSVIEDFPTQAKEALNASSARNAADLRRLGSRASSEGSSSIIGKVDRLARKLRFDRRYRPDIERNDALGDDKGAIAHAFEGLFKDCRNDSECRAGIPYAYRHLRLPSSACYQGKPVIALLNEEGTPWIAVVYPDQGHLHAVLDARCLNFASAYNEALRDEIDALVSSYSDDACR